MKFTLLGTTFHLVMKFTLLGTTFHYLNRQSHHEDYPGDEICSIWHNFPLFKQAISLLGFHLFMTFTLFGTNLFAQSHHENYSKLVMIFLCSARLFII
jgi:hypothetical protein